MKGQITNLRLKIDSLSLLTKTIRTQKNYYETRVIGDMIKTSYSISPNVQKCFDSLILAKARLGKILGLLGEETPYKNDGKRNSVEDIEQAADVVNKNLPDYMSDGKGHNWKDMNDIQKIDFLREEVQKVREECLELSMSPLMDVCMRQGGLVKRMDYSVQFISLLSELDNARFYLGFELGRLRDDK